MERVWRDLIVSLALHIIFWALIGLIPELPKPEAPITFDVVPKNQLQKTAVPRAQSIVRNAPTLDQNLTEKDDPTKFLSEKTQRVKEQTRAQISGLTSNRSSQPKEKKEDTAKAKSSQVVADEKSLDRFLPSKIKFPTAGEDKGKEEAKNTQKVNPGFTDLGQSTVAEDLPADIKFGDITSLNTDRYLYYSYFARAQELLWNEWAPRVEGLLTRPPASMRASPHSHFTTSIEVWFHPDGTVHSTHLMKSSGIAELDYIAEASFKSIRRIPNPPREKIEKDGLIRFQWGLTVEYDPKVLVRQ